MHYYLNDYSLRGQYNDIDDFLQNLREHTLPIFKKIEEEKESVIYKKDTLWKAEVCKGMSLYEVSNRRNERTAEIQKFKSDIVKMYQVGPFWSNVEVPDIEIKEYEFDKDYSIQFEIPNCFTKAILDGGEIISFMHPEYNISVLQLVVAYQDRDEKCSLTNIYDLNYWNNNPITTIWHHEDKFIIQVRAREFDYHPPHFHVTSKEYSAVFRLDDGTLYTHGKKGWPSKLTDEVKIWYKENKGELQEAWRFLHSRDVVAKE